MRRSKFIVPSLIVFVFLIGIVTSSFYDYGLILYGSVVQEDFSDEELFDSFIQENENYFLEEFDCMSLDGVHCFAIEGEGNSFEIISTDYLDLNVASTENISLYLESISNIISFQIKGSGGIDSTEITLSGLENGRTYYRYEDGNLEEEFIANGDYSYTQDLLSSHHVFIKEEVSTIYILSNGSVSPSSAPIVQDGNTYTLTNNINEPIYIQKSGIVLDGANYSSSGTGGDYGIYVNGLENIEIKNFNIDGFLYGIYFYFTDDSKIIDNSVVSGNFGISLLNVENINISNNFVTGGFMSIRLSDVFYGTIKNNLILNSNLAGIMLDLGSSYININENNLTNTPMGIYLYNASQNIMFNNSVYESSKISFGNYIGFNNSFDSNTILGFFTGFYLSGGSANNFLNNNLVANGISKPTINNPEKIRQPNGVLMYQSTNNVFKNNVFVNRSGGIVFRQDFFSEYVQQDIDTSNTVDGKPIYYWIGHSDETVPSDAGLVGLINCNNISVENLTLSHSGGIYLAYTNNSVVKNIQTSENFVGMLVHDSFNNQIYHNTISNNTFQIYHYEGSVNTWDDSSGQGNYWSDYKGVDDGSDGRVSGDLIGDTSLPHQGVDYYPLLSCYVGPGEDVEVEANENVTLIFENANSGGVTIATEADEEPEPLEGFKLGSTYYDIETTANYSGTITIAIEYDDTGMNYGQERRLKLYHYDEDNEKWEDITTLRDIDNNIIYGETDSLSIFLVMYSFADVSGPYEANEGEEVILDASESDNPENETLEYRWDLDNDGVWDTDYMTSPSYAYIWDDDYIGEIALEVKYTGFTSVAVTEVIISNVVPVVDVGGNKEVIAGEEIMFSGSFVDQGLGDTHIIEWNFGDGETSSELIINHTYEEAGEYLVTLTVTDDDGGVGEDTLNVDVSSVEATLDVDPDIINLKSKGKWITGYIELPSEYDVNNIDISTVELNNVFAETSPTEIGDYDGDSIIDLMLKFSSDLVQETLEIGDDVEIFIKGKLASGKIFEGSDFVKVK